MVCRQHVSLHPWTSLVLLPSSQTPGSGCCPRWDTRSCTGLNVPHLAIHVKQRKPFLPSYCSGLEVVETQSFNFVRWVWAAQGFTVNLLCANER